MGNGMNKILPGLFVGNFRDSKDQEQLRRHGVSHILAIHDNARKLPCNNDKEYLCIIASDCPGQNLMQFFPICNDFVHYARLNGGSVLIHCLAGMSRSVTVAVVYVMSVTSLNWRDALKAVQGARNVANPNVGFLKQIQEFAKERLHDERRRIHEKFPGHLLWKEDVETARDLLTAYYDHVNSGTMCDGNCQQGIVCPRGLCNQSRSLGIFRRNSRESSSCKSRSPQWSTPTPERHYSNTQSPTNRSPISSNSDYKENIQSVSPSNSSVSNFEECDEFVCTIDNRSNSSINNFYGQLIAPASPSRSFGYYTNSPTKLTSDLQDKTCSKFKGGVYCSTKSFKDSKIVHWSSSKYPTDKNIMAKNLKSNQIQPPPSPRQSKESTFKCESVIRVESPEDLDSALEKESYSVYDEICKTEPESFFNKHTKQYSDDNSSNILKEETISKKKYFDSESVSSANIDTQAPKSRFCQVVNLFFPKLFKVKSSKLSKNPSTSETNEYKSILCVDRKDTTNYEYDKDDSYSFNNLVITKYPQNSEENNEQYSSSTIFEKCRNYKKNTEKIGAGYKSELEMIESKDMCKKNNLMSTKLDTSKYKNCSKKNIFVNPTFFLENTSDSDSTFIKKSDPFSERKISSCMAYLDDDMMYVETHDNVSHPTIKTHLGNKQSSSNAKINPHSYEGMTDSLYKNGKHEPANLSFTRYDVEDT